VSTIDGYLWCKQHLTDKEMFAIDVACDGFGYCMETIDTCIYAMFGYQTLEDYINTVESEG
jgi:hypothetical protein